MRKNYLINSRQLQRIVESLNRITKRVGVSKSNILSETEYVIYNFGEFNVGEHKIFFNKLKRLDGYSSKDTEKIIFKLRNDQYIFNNEDVTFNPYGAHVSKKVFDDAGYNRKSISPKLEPEPVNNTTPISQVPKLSDDSDLPDEPKVTLEPDELEPEPVKKYENEDCEDINLDKLRNELEIRLKGDYKFYKTPFQQIWNKYGKLPNEKQMTKLNNGLDLLQEKFSWTNEEKNSLTQNILSIGDPKWGIKHKFIFDKKGDWLPINKLTGNLKQFIDIVVKLFEKYKDNQNVKNIYCDIINFEGGIYDNLKKQTFVDIINTEINNNIVKWGEKNSETTKRYSVIGADVEDEFKKFMTEVFEGSEIRYEGGDGDLIDIGLSIDLIIEYMGKIITIQCKNSKNTAKNFYQKAKANMNNIRYKFVDRVIYPYKSGFVFIDIKTGKETYISR